MDTRPEFSASRHVGVLNQRLNPAGEALDVPELKGSSRTVRAHQELISEGRRAASAFFVNEGIAIRYRILRDGQRQILNLLIPGDLTGITSCFFEASLYSIRAVTNMTVTPVPLAKLISLFDANPGLPAKVFRLFAREAAICAEHLIGVGRRPAPERIAHFLLELLMRLRASGLANERSYRLPLTQEMISDALGLSIPYVNRVVHQLRDAGLIRLDRQTVAVEDIDELARFADFQHQYLAPLSIAELLGESEPGEPERAVVRGAAV